MVDSQSATILLFKTTQIQIVKKSEKKVNGRKKIRIGQDIRKHSIFVWS